MAIELTCYFAANELYLWKIQQCKGALAMPLDPLLANLEQNIRIMKEY